jgi:hypothetical protein
MPEYGLIALLAVPVNPAFAAHPFFNFHYKEHNRKKHQTEQQFIAQSFGFEDRLQNRHIQHRHLLGGGCEPSPAHGLA